MKRNTVGWLLGVFAVAVLNWQCPFIRLANHWANELVAVLATCIPLVLMGAGIARVLRRPNPWVAALLGAVLVVLCLPLLAVVVFRAFTLPPHANALDGSFEQVAQVGEHVAVYRTNGGATTAYGIVVRQEREFFPGVLLVRNVFAQYRLERVSCQLTGPSLTVRHPTSGQVLAAVTLKRFVYL